MSNNGRIVVPETFSHILKTYAKDVVRTQPYDLLQWSAAYFRSIANNVETPTKIRFEEYSESSFDERSLTKEFLKVLVKQVGKGYFVERNVLQKKWRESCLSENELLLYLNVCGMYSWEQIHWLKLLSVLAASMCENFTASIDFICELLTEDADGGENALPFWMLNECYTFLAQLDCSSERQAISNETTINQTKSMIDPMTIDAKRFRNHVLIEWKVLIKKPEHKMDTAFFKTFNMIKTANDFQQIIHALVDYQSNGKDDEDFDTTFNLELHQKLIREIGAPWNWIHQFVDHNSSHSKSYNFCECISSDSVQQISALTEPFDTFIPKISGIGASIPDENIQTFLNHLKTQVNDDGLIFPKYFKDSQCPSME